ncbi:inverted formin-2-like [Orbicella faveolata]|uniref:inverted formin-2-like n=1 Tax=Orbicella faveolata TaxID=48498 RepID=UPI0009E31AFD|nr:inverted formin-2-like [Orbicella faveolata]
MALNASRSKWRRISDQNDVSSVVSGLIADADPELCVKLLKTPSLKNFSGIRPRLEKASKEWLSEFLNLGGFDCLFDGLTSLSSRNGLKFTEALEQIECVRCIKAVMNSSVGLEVMTANNELTRSLVKGKRLETYSNSPWARVTDSVEYLHVV